MAGGDIKRLTRPGGIIESHAAHRRSGEGSEMASESSADA
jgi:hypothetical protein